MIRKIIKDSRGVSLVEMLAVISILSFIIITIITVQNQFTNIYNEVNNGTMQNENTSFFIDFISDKTRDSSNIEVSDDVIKLTLKTGETVQFAYDSAMGVINYINEENKSFKLLENVEVYSPTVIGSVTNRGLDLHIEVESGGTTLPFDIKVYAYVGQKGN